MTCCETMNPTTTLLRLDMKKFELTEEELSDALNPYPSAKSSILAMTEDEFCQQFMGISNEIPSTETANVAPVEKTTMEEDSLTKSYKQPTTLGEILTLFLSLDTEEQRASLLRAYANIILD